MAAGVIKTPVNPPETYESKKESNPVGRLGEIKEVVDAVLFLTDATFTTGEIRRSAKFVGRFGAELNVEAARKAAHLGALSALAVARQEVRSLVKS